MLKCWECGYGLQVILIEGFWAVVSKVIERRKQKCFALFRPFCVQKIQSNWIFFLLFTVSHSVLIKLTLYHRCFYISRFFLFFLLLSFSASLGWWITDTGCFAFIAALFFQPHTFSIENAWREITSLSVCFVWVSHLWKKKHIFNSRKSCGLSTLLSVKTTNDRRDEVVLFKTSHRWPNYVEHRHSRGCLL